MTRKIFLFFWALLGLLVLSENSKLNYVLIGDEQGHVELISLQASVDFSQKPIFDPTEAVHLYLYTSENSEAPVEITQDANIDVFNSQNPTRIAIHGWHSSASSYTDLKDAYLAIGDYNVILIDWSARSSLFYTEAVLDVPTIGEYVGSLIADQLISKQGASLDNIYVIGHSLGAHISGVIGRVLNGKVARVVGLDAALPLYDLIDLEDKLDSSDAQEVVGIHTCSGTLGQYDPFGTVDFYPNGGSNQPGCGVDITGACSHSRSHLFYTESVQGGKFIGDQCADMDHLNSKDCTSPSAIMGEFTPTGTKGIYYLETNEEPPYAQG